MKVLECSQHYTFIFQMLKGSLLSSCDGIWQKFKLILAFMVVVVTCKNDEVKKHFSHYKSMENDSDIQRQLTP